MADELIKNENAVLDSEQFSRILFEKMKQINPGIQELEFYEFVYGLDNLVPDQGWYSISLEDIQTIELKISQKEFFTSLKNKPVKNNKFVLDELIIGLSQMLLKGLVTDYYSITWLNSKFYFDIRSFIFFPRTQYFSQEVLTHFGGVPFRSFEKKQEQFSSFLEIGYKDFKAANTDVDHAFIDMVEKLVQVKNHPFLLTLAGPTAAGKTEIVSRLKDQLSRKGFTVATVEMDNFNNDKEYRDTRANILETIHFEAFTQSIQSILTGKKINIPRYDFYKGISSHDPNGNIRPGSSCIEIDPADIIFLEGNFPFHLPEISHLIGVKIVYLTDDEIRLKRKWKRDIDLRKKYDPVNFVNRYFRTQFIRAEEIYLPLMKICDMVVDTTAANIWVTTKLRESLV
ncbi:MAG: uridine kinase family protein [Anaerolineaceae bacterium]